MDLLTSVENCEVQERAFFCLGCAIERNGNWENTEHIYKCITFGCEFIKCFSQKDGSAKSSTSLIAIPVCIRIGTFINMLIQIHHNLLKNNFTPNIVHSL